MDAKLLSTIDNDKHKEFPCVRGYKSVYPLTVDRGSYAILRILCGFHIRFVCPVLRLPRSWGRVALERLSSNASRIAE